MAFEIEEEELYGRALYTIDNNGQEVNVAFEPSDGDSYLMIIFCDDYEQITNYHNPELWDTLFKILRLFDKRRKLDYKIIAV